MHRGSHPWVFTVLSLVDVHTAVSSGAPLTGSDAEVQGGPRSMDYAVYARIVWPPWYPGWYVRVASLTPTHLPVSLLGILPYVSDSHIYQLYDGRTKNRRSCSQSVHQQ